MGPGAISAARSKSRPAEPQPPHWNGENLAKKKRPPESATRPEEEQVNNGGGFWPQKASEKEKQEKEKGKEAGTAKAKGKGMETNTETKKEAPPQDPLEIITDQMEGKVSKSKAPPGLPKPPGDSGSSSAPPGL